LAELEPLLNVCAAAGCRTLVIYITISSDIIISHR
jgi:hypothetical protein